MLCGWLRIGLEVEGMVVEPSDWSTPPSVSGGSMLMVWMVRLG